MVETAHLTPREVEVLRLIANGCTYTQVALRLHVSPNTITTYIKNSYLKLGVHSGAAAVMKAVELGFIRPSAGPVFGASEAKEGR